MFYNSAWPTAVFLGPSLPKSEAVDLLPANYYPPAQMGDIYRLLGTGVQTIILIDGLFHGKAAVWQREILLALENGITVVGAASMGALRAAELHPYGMVGCGTIFEWYRDGHIDGDDEVALIHADESNDYLPLSDPLVTIRYNLQRAVAANIVTPSQAKLLIVKAKSLSFTERSFLHLLAQQVMPDTIKKRLRDFWHAEMIDLKRQDAIQTLTSWQVKQASQLTAPTPVPKQQASVPVLRDSDRYHQQTIAKERGFLTTDQRLIRGEAIIAQWRKEKGQTAAAMETQLIKRFFLGVWTQHQNFSSQCEQRSLLDWLYEQEPATLGFKFGAWKKFTAVLPTLLPWQQTTSQDSLRQEVYEIFYLAQWTKENGICCPAPFAEHFRQQWETACRLTNREAWLAQTRLTRSEYEAILHDWATVSWIVQKKPPFFGYASWSLTAVLLEELQISGEAANLSIRCDTL